MRELLKVKEKENQLKYWLEYQQFQEKIKVPLQTKRNFFEQEQQDKNSSTSSENNDKISIASSTLTETFEENTDYNHENIKVDSFILAALCKKKITKHFIEKVTKCFDNGEFEVSFLLRNGNKFVFPDIPDISSLSEKEIVLHLPEPVNTGGTARMARSFKFEIDFSKYSNVV